MKSVALRSSWVRAGAFALFVAAAVPAQDAPAPAAETLRFGRARLENVSVARGSASRRTVSLTNLTAEQVQVTKVSVQGAALGVGLIRDRVLAPVTLDTAMQYTLPGNEVAHVELTFDASDSSKGELPLGERSSTLVIETGATKAELPITWEIVETRKDTDEEKPSNRVRTDLSKWAVKGPQPLLECDRYIHDFGKVLSGERLRTSFTLRNDGEGDLMIIRVETQCHCTLPRLMLPGREVTKKELATKEGYGALKKGEEATIEVEVDTAGMGGFVKKSVAIVTNDAVNSPQRLSLNLTVDNPFEFSTTTARFGDVRRGQKVEKTVRIASKDQGKFAIVGYELPQPQALDLQYREVKARKDEQCAWELVLTSRDDLPCREYIGRVRLDLDHERIKSVDQLHYQLRIVPDVQWVLESEGVPGRHQRTSPENLSLRVVRPGQNDEQVLVFENQNPKTPWIPIEAKIVAKLGSEPFATEIVELEKGQKYQLKIKVVAAPKAKAFKGELHVKAESVSLPELKIAFSGIWAGPNATPATAPAETPAKDGSAGQRK
jgi:hypothetical protein